MPPIIFIPLLKTMKTIMIKDGINMYSNYVINSTMAQKLSRKFIQ